MARKKTVEKEVVEKEVVQEQKPAEKPATTGDRVQDIEFAISKQQRVSAEDVAFLLGQLKERTAHLKQYETTLVSLKGKLADQAKAVGAAKEILTLWLAMRGSCGLDVFQATQGLANRTVTLLNQ
jgi:hypothetical protein